MAVKILQSEGSGFNAKAIEKDFGGGKVTFQPWGRWMDKGGVEGDPTVKVSILTLGSAKTFIARVVSTNVERNEVELSCWTGEKGSWRFLDNTEVAGVLELLDVADYESLAIAAIERSEWIKARREEAGTPTEFAG